VNRAGALVSVSGTWEEQATEWGKGQMTTIAMRVSKVPPGGRHQALIEAAVSAGHLIVEGCTTLGFAYDALNRAAQMAGLHGEGREDEVRRTILNGFHIALTKRSAGIRTLIETVEAQQ
jgi:hypothetical protein